MNLITCMIIDQDDIPEVYLSFVSLLFDQPFPHHWSSCLIYWFCICWIQSKLQAYYTEANYSRKFRNCIYLFVHIQWSKLSFLGSQRICAQYSVITSFWLWYIPEQFQKDLHPCVFPGLGFAVTIIRFLQNVYYNVILAWSFHYLFTSISSVLGALPWAHCENPWNTPSCIQSVRQALLGSSNSTNGSFAAEDTTLIPDNASVQAINTTHWTDPTTEYWEWVSDAIFPVSDLVSILVYYFYGVESWSYLLPWHWLWCYKGFGEGLDDCGEGGRILLDSQKHFSTLMSQHLQCIAWKETEQSKA